MRAITVTLLSLTTLLVAAASPAAAADEAPPFLFQFSEPGSGAGQLVNPRGVGIDPRLPGAPGATGHVFVQDNGNFRISEFTAWGDFVKAWGWGVRDGSSAELQTCGPGAVPPAEACFQGIKGTGPGQSNAGGGGVAVDSNGDVYAVDINSDRVQKFSADGDFILTFGGEVNKTTTGDVCTEASGNVCGAGVEGTGPGEFSGWPLIRSFIAVSPTDSVYVGDKGRIQEFNSDGTFKDEITLEGELAGKQVSALALDPSTGNFYLAFTDGDDVYRVNSAGVPLGSVEVQAPRAVAVSSEGDLFVVSDHGVFDPSELLVFDPTGMELPGNPLAADLDESTGIGISAIDGIYVSNNRASPQRAYVRAYGTAPTEYEPPPTVPPIVTEQFAIEVDSEGATVGAEINPKFWTDATYYVEYGIAPCSAGGCAVHPAPPGSALTTKVSGSPVKTAGVFLSGLEPSTTYHFRFVAQSSGGGLVFGDDATFTTPAPPSLPAANCPNVAFRTGLSAALADCRAYEMVSPLDKNNGDVVGLPSFNDFPAELIQSAAGGQRVTYTSYRAFGNAVSGPYVSQYLATRAAAGWTSDGISPPRGLRLSHVQQSLDTAFKAFNEDLSRSWLFHDTDPPLAPGAVDGFANLYRRDSGGGFQALTTVAPPNPKSEAFELELQGASEDGAVAAFIANDAIAAGGTAGKTQLYVARPGGAEPRFACALPSGFQIKGDCAAGTRNTSLLDTRRASVTHALSADGGRLYWTSAAAPGPGTLYLRVNPAEEESAHSGGACTEPQKACSFLISELPAQFWAASADGAKAIYTIPATEQLFEYDAEAKASNLIAAGVKGVAAVSEDAARVYFVSAQDLDEGATAGQPNLYLAEDGAFDFIATLSGDDVFGQLSPITSTWPVRHTATTNPVGGTLAFSSASKALAEATAGYDNTDVASGQADREVYLYDATADELVCASCNPSGARPRGREIAKGINNTIGPWAAAQLPAPLTQLYSPRALSADGTRLFFESFDPLVSRDTNGRQDVYEWEAPGAGDCDEVNPAFAPSAGGCLNLISSGQSPADSELLDASANGDDVFFTTAASLTPPDYGLIDIYDARVGGGFPPPALPGPECEGAACQSPSATPPPPAPSSAAFRGPGNQGAPARARRCPRGKRRVRRRGKVRCVKPSRRCPKGKSKVRRGGKVRCAKLHRAKRQGRHRRLGRAGR